MEKRYCLVFAAVFEPGIDCFWAMRLVNENGLGLPVIELCEYTSLNEQNFILPDHMDSPIYPRLLATSTVFQSTLVDYYMIQACLWRWASTMASGHCKDVTW